MALQIQFVAEEDIPGAARLHLRAFADFPLLNAIYPGAAQSPIWLDHMCHAMEAARADSAQHLLKVSALEGGQLMGIAQWERCSSASVDHKPSPARPLPEGGNVEVHAAHGKERSEKRAAIMGDRPYYCELHGLSHHEPSRPHVLRNHLQIWRCSPPIWHTVVKAWHGHWYNGVWTVQRQTVSRHTSKQDRPHSGFTPKWVLTKQTPWMLRASIQVRMAYKMRYIAWFGDHGPSAGSEVFQTRQDMEYHAQPGVRNGIGAHEIGFSIWIASYHPSRSCCRT